MPVELRIVVKMQINAVAARAVEIAGERSQRAFQVRRTAGYVVPRVADLISSRRIECQWIAVAIHRSIEGHARVDAVVESLLDHVRKLGITRYGQHPPV